jgi:hypothetical protein
MIESKMRLTVAHRGQMCSTLVLGHLPYGDSSFSNFVKQFKVIIRDTDNKEDYTKRVENQFEKEVRRDGATPIYEGHVQKIAAFDSYKFEHFGFVVATTLDDHYRAGLNKNMREFGFIESKPVHNSKNVTTCILWQMAVSDILLRLAEFDSDGLEIKKEVSIECAA